MTETAFKGSEWNKWDLHLHTPFTKLSDNFKAIGSDEIWKTYCDKIESSDVVCFGITDYFSCDNYYTFLENHKTHYPQSEKVFFLNIEFRLEVGVNKAGEEVNIHIIFSDKVVRSKVEEFLTLIETNITRSEARVACKNMQQDDFVSAGIRYDQLRPTLSKIFGKDNCYFILAASNNAGLRADSNSPRKLNITDEIDKVFLVSSAPIECTMLFKLRIDIFQGRSQIKSLSYQEVMLIHLRIYKILLEKDF